MRPCWAGHEDVLQVLIWAAHVARVEATAEHTAGMSAPAPSIVRRCQTQRTCNVLQQLIWAFHATSP